MRVFLQRKIKVHKTSARAARKRRIAEIEKMVSGLTLNQLNSVCRYARLLRSTTNKVH
jgi:hypothetical protein